MQFKQGQLHVHKKMFSLGYSCGIGLILCCALLYTYYNNRRENTAHFPWSQTRLEPVSNQKEDPLRGIRIVSRRMHDHSYRRTEFGPAWTDDNSAALGHNFCDTRDDILLRDLQNIVTGHRAVCATAVLSGDLWDPYTGNKIHFIRGPKTSDKVQIDHIVPLAYIWDMGAANWNYSQRVQIANDPENLIAVSGIANQAKGDKPPGEWQPSNSTFLCQYNSEFAKVIRKYHLSVEIGTANAIRYFHQHCAILPRS